MAMEITVTQEGEAQVITLAGRLDTNTSPQLESEVGSLYEGNTPDIIVDMSACEFVSSAGLRVIVAMQKRATAGGSLVFRDVKPEVMDVFEMTGFDNILTFA